MDAIAAAPCGYCRFAAFARDGGLSSVEIALRHVAPSSHSQDKYLALLFNRLEPFPQCLMRDADDHKRVRVHFLDDGFERGHFGA